MSLLLPFLRPKSSPGRSTTIACASLLLPPTDVRDNGNRRRWTSTPYREVDNSGTRRRRRRREPAAAAMENVFIHSLVAAGTCKRCAAAAPITSSSSSSWLRVRSRDGAQQYGRSSRRGIHISARLQQNFAFAPVQEPENNDISREEYKDLVNTYNIPSDMWEEAVPPHRPPSRPVTPPREHLPLAPRLVLTPEQEERSLPRPRLFANLTHPDEISRLRHLTSLLEKKPGYDTNAIWHLYSSLPQPRAAYLSDSKIHRLLRCLAWVEFKNAGDHANRYFETLQDCLDINFQPNSAEWNTAIAYAGRRNRPVSTDNVRRAVEEWMRMDDAEVEPHNVTFNILYSIASRSRRFALADTVLGELVARGLALNRFQRVNTIFNAGLKRDGDAVRRCFRDYVNAGEIVDTAVMNCVVLALVRSGEIPSAEDVVQRMKNLAAAKGERSKDRTWQEEKALGKQLDHVAQQLRQEKEEHEATFFGSEFSNQDHKEKAQRLAPIAPNFRTRRILARCHCLITGELKRVRELMAEMKEEDGRVPGAVYVWLFIGFWQWGGYAFTEWNRKSLEEFWREFLEAAKERQAVRKPAPHDQHAGLVVDLSSSKPLTDMVQEGEKDDPTPPPRPSDYVNESSSSHDDPNDPDDDFDSSEMFRAFFQPEETVPHARRLAFFSPLVAVKAVFAFYKCAGPKRARRVWEEIQVEWVDLRQDEKEDIEKQVGRILTDPY